MWFEGKCQQGILVGLAVLLSAEVPVRVKNTKCDGGLADMNTLGNILSRSFLFTFLE